MNGFFDLRKFIALLLRKIHWIIIVTLVLAVAWGAVRFVPQMMEYINYEEPAPVTEEQQEQSAVPAAESDLPYQYESTRMIYIRPTGVTVGSEDTSLEIARAYAGYYRSEAVIDPLVDEFFDRAMRADATDKQRRVDYNYSTRSTLSEPYEEVNFIRSITCDAPQTGSALVTLHVTTPDSQLSEEIINRAVELLQDHVTDILGNHTAVITEGAQVMQLPSAQTGLTPQTSAGSSTQAVETERPSLRAIAVNTIKGCIWGAIIGFALSIVVLLFFDVVSVKVTTEDELKNYGKPILASGRRPGSKGKRFFIHRWADKLEGNSTPCADFDSLCNVVREDALTVLGGDVRKIAVSGTAPKPSIEKFADALRKSFGSGTEIVLAPEIATNADSIAASRGAQGVIFAEEIMKSNKIEIERELKKFEELDVPQLGFVFFK